MVVVTEAGDAPGGGGGVTKKANIEMARCYTLSDVETMAHTLASNGAITPLQHVAALRVVVAVGRAWGLI